jgi:hypothetical protein
VKLPKLTPNDQLNFHIDVLSHSVDSNSITRLKTLLHTYQEFSCKRFLHEGQDWIQSILFHQDFTFESLKQLAQRFIPKARELFDFNEELFGSDIAKGVGFSDARKFTLRLTIVVEKIVLSIVEI